MNDERIEGLIRDRYEAIRSTKEPIAKPHRRRWLVPAVSAAAAVAASVVILTISLHPTPAQAVGRAERALAESVSFQVKVVTDTGRGERYDFVIKRSGDLLIQELDRPSVASLLVVQDEQESWLQAKGENVVYRSKVDRTQPAFMVPEKGESFLAFLLRTLWQPRTPQGHKPVDVLQNAPKPGMHTIRYEESLESTYLDRETKTDREVLLQIDKATDRPATMLIREASKPGIERTLRYEFSYNHEPRLPFEDYFRPGSRIVDLDTILREIHAEWDKRKPIVDNGEHKVLETFHSPLGWTAIVIKGPMLYPQASSDQEGNQWLAQYRQERQNYRVVHVTPLEPDHQAANPVITLRLQNEAPLQIPIPVKSPQNLPDWILAYGGVVKKWRYDIEAVGMRCMHYQSQKDYRNELRWRRIYLKQAEKIGGSLLTIQQQRISELEGQLRP